jgi:biopolymer transport protein ExbB
MKIARIVAVMMSLVPTLALAWWNDGWKQRTVVTLNTTAAGVSTHDALSGFAVPLRLHSGNFDFISAKQDGSDLRVVAGDDKTPLKFWIERYDSVDELAVLWVQLPSVAPNSDKNTVYVYAGNEAPPADGGAATSPAAIADAATLAAFHFADKDFIAADQSGSIKSAAAYTAEPSGLIGQSARLAGTPIVWEQSGAAHSGAGGSYTVSLWIRPEAVEGTLFRQGPLSMAFANGKLVAKVGSASLDGGAVAPGNWSQIVLTLGAGKAELYLNGASSSHVSADTPAVDGAIRVGEGFRGLVDELEISNAVRGAEWIQVGYAAQSADAKLIASKTEAAGAESSGSSNSYFGILFKSLTPDAWVVIGILGVMFLIAAAVMVTKALYVSKTDRANRRFLKSFRESEDVLSIEGRYGETLFRGSSLYRIYRAGLNELQRRSVGPGNSQRLTGTSLDAVKAAIDADSVREGYALNSAMVLLTIAISGGPFLGLLGTVVGVMITFASIAAAGDVNVNAIAPGIAAALLATVAGLSVAIPSLFGYNYLASRIKTISSDMQIFIDEFVTRVAESYGAP